MTQPVTIENESLRLQIWPQLGGKISSMVDKYDGFDLFFNYPSEIPVQASQYDLPYAKGWYAGCDECFPAVGPSRYVGHPYDGIPVPDHGELWSLPTTAVPMKDGIITVWHGLRFGYRLTRNLYLEGPAVVADYSLVNLAPFEFRFVWALHPLMTMSMPVELDLPGGMLFRLSHDAENRELGQQFKWPLTPDGHDLSKPCDLPAQLGWKIYAAHPIQTPMGVRYPQRNRSVTIEYGSEEGMPAYWGIWINTGGWGTHRHFAIEPTTGRFDQIDRAIHDHSAGRLAPLATRIWTTRLTVGSIL